MFGQRVIQIEWYALLISVFSFPLFESPKTIFLLLSATAFIVRHAGERDLSRVLLRFDPRLGFLALAVSAALSAFFAMKPGLAIKGCFDPLMMFFLFSIVATDFSDEKSIVVIAWSVIAGTTAASAWGLAEVALQKRPLLELHSVGHANHSSIYLVLSIWVILCLFVARRAFAGRAVMSISLACIISALILTQSRATYLALVLSIAGIFMFSGIHKRGIAAAATVVSIAIAALWSYAYFAKPAALQKGISFASIMMRFEHWQMAWQLFLHHPVVGIGAKSLRLYEPGMYGFVMTEKLSHAHNLFLNTLVHFGIVGFGALCWLFFLALRYILGQSGYSIMRPAACAGLIIVVVNGMLNTTLHSEHGLLFALILAMVVIKPEPVVKRRTC
ncbi:MAG: O-antigen polymerase [Nitrospirae bacterium]|nr:MAG: O-antigen polymerase [Nitrospirota bacterium]